ncbi:putative actin-97-like [Capsicum annuum]|nr:putative actin-97-like [Capsicum annuum]
MADLESRVTGMDLAESEVANIQRKEKPYNLDQVLRNILKVQSANGVDRAKCNYCGHVYKQHNTALLVDMVRQQFRKHMHETDPDEIQKLKDDAARGLINHMLHESEKMTGRKFSQGS